MNDSKLGKVEESLSIFPDKDGGSINKTEAIGGHQSLPGGKGLGTVATFIFELFDGASNPHHWTGLDKGTLPFDFVRCPVRLSRCSVRPTW